MIKVLIVESSKVIQEFIDHILDPDPEIEVVGICDTVSEAIEIIKAKSPHIITMDVNIPGIDGAEATRVIMETLPTPIIALCEIGNNSHAAIESCQLGAGALTVVLRPAPFDVVQYPIFRNELIKKVKLMSEIKVVKLFHRNQNQNLKSVESPQPFENEILRTQIIAIGASTGGPVALQIILSRLPANLAVPVLIVQHIAPGFVNGFQKMLSSSSGIALKVAEDGEKLLPGFGYIAPDNFHMGVSQDKRIDLSDQAPENGSKPSVSYLFRSVARVYGSNALGVLLTGMGKDGAEELKDLKNKGAITVVQNEESSVVFGMPYEALKIGASNMAMSPENIAEIIIKAGTTMPENI